MRLDKEFKNDVKREMKEADYVGSRIFVRIVVVLFVIGLLSSGGYFVFGKLNKNIERDAFKQSVTYNEAAASFLAKSYSEYNASDSDTEKKAIMQYVRDRYPNLDTSKLENSHLVTFYNKCMMGE